jgi:hypothetical protein
MIKKMEILSYDTKAAAQAAARYLNPDYMELKDSPDHKWELTDDSVAVRYEKGRGCIDSSRQWTGLISGAASKTMGDAEHGYTSDIRYVAKEKETGQAIKRRGRMRH